MLATLVAYLRACEAQGLRPRAALRQDRAGAGGGCRPVPDDRQAARRPQAGRPRGRGLRRLAAPCDKLHLAATTSERMMARRDPWVNMLRTTVACAGAAFGGADAITVLPFTWAMGKPDAFARRIARNTHLVLQEESALGRVMDPGHGAWFIEKLTRGPGQGGMAALPGRSRPRAAWAPRSRAGFIQAEIAQGRRGARPRHRHGPPRADGRLSLPAAGRGRRQGRAAPAGRARRQGRHLGCAAASAPAGRAVRAPARCGRRPPRQDRQAAAQVFLAVSAISPRIRRARPGRAISSPPAASRPSPASRAAQLRRRRQGLRRQRRDHRLHLLLRPGLCRAGRGHGRRAEGGRRENGAARRPAEERRRRR